MTITITLKMSEITYKDLTYNWLYLKVTFLTAAKKQKIIYVVFKPEFSKFPKKIKGMVAEFISM